MLYALHRTDDSQQVFLSHWRKFCLFLRLVSYTKYLPSASQLKGVPAWKEFLCSFRYFFQHVRKLEKPPSFWTPDFTSVFIIKFCLSGINYMMVPVMVVYGKQFGTVQDAGIAVAIFFVPVILVRLIAGHVCDWFGSKKLLLVIIGLMGLLFVGYLQVASYEQLLVVRVLDGLAFAIVSPPLDTISSGVMQPERWRESNACLGTAGTLAMAVFPAIGIFWVSKDCIWLVFLFGFSITVLSFCLVFRLPDTKAMRAAESDKNTKKSGSIWQTIRIVSPYGLIWAFVTIYLGCTISYIIPYAEEMGYHGLDWLVLMIYTLVVIAIRRFAGQLVDRREKMQLRMSIFSIICFMAGALLLCCKGLVFFFLAFVFNGVAYGCLNPCVTPLAKALVLKLRPGLGMGTYSTIYILGEFFASLLGGWLGAIVGFRYMWLVLMGLGLIPAFVLTLKYMRCSMPVIELEEVTRH
jgi:MFS family permease